MFSRVQDKNSFPPRTFHTSGWNLLHEAPPNYVRHFPRDFLHTFCDRSILCVMVQSVYQLWVRVCCSFNDNMFSSLSKLYTSSLIYLTHTLRKQSRQADRRWMEDSLHVSLVHLRDSLSAFQWALQEQESKSLSYHIQQLSSSKSSLVIIIINPILSPLFCLALDLTPIFLFPRF